jgi:hypothetical protein
MCTLFEFSRNSLTGFEWEDWLGDSISSPANIRWKCSTHASLYSFQKPTDLANVEGRRTEVILWMTGNVRETASWFFYMAFNSVSCADLDYGQKYEYMRWHTTPMMTDLYWTSRCVLNYLCNIVFQHWSITHSCTFSSVYNATHFSFQMTPNLH